jgi:hypothetical protein
MEQKQESRKYQKNTYGTIVAHDTGYIKNGDVDGTGAKYTFIHMEAFLRNY